MVLDSNRRPDNNGYHGSVKGLGTWGRGRSATQNNFKRVSIQGKSVVATWICRLGVIIARSLSLRSFHLWSPMGHHNQLAVVWPMLPPAQQKSAPSTLSAVIDGHFIGVSSFFTRLTPSSAHCQTPAYISLSPVYRGRSYTPQPTPLFAPSLPLPRDWEFIFFHEV